MKVVAFNGSPRKDGNTWRLIKYVFEVLESEGIEALKWLDSQSIATFIRMEHPQTVAIILAHMEPDLAAEVLARPGPHIGKSYRPTGPRLLSGDDVAEAWTVEQVAAVAPSPAPPEPLPVRV